MTNPDSPTAPAEVGVLQRHPTDLVSLFAGLVFVAAGVAALGAQLDWFGAGGEVWWGLSVAAVALIALVATVAATLRRSRRAP